MNFALSLKQIKKIPFEKLEKNFTFIVNGKHYETNRFVADFLSPVILNYHYLDETINFFEFSTDIDKETGNSLTDERDYFQEFLQLVDFQSKQISKSQKDHYIEYFIHLGNFDEYCELQKENLEELTPENVIDRLEIFLTSLQKFNYTKLSKNVEIVNEAISNENIKQIIKYASSHFDQIDKSKMKKINIDMIEEILKNEELKLEDEDTLLNFVLDLYENNDQFSSLFEYVKFENVSEESLSNFIDKFDYQLMTAGVWKSICHRLVPNDQEKGNRYKQSYKKFVHKEGEDFNGIIRYLTNKYGGNVHDKGVVDISSTSIQGDKIAYHPKNLVDYQNSSNYYYSKPEPSVIISFDFKDYLIQLTNYTIKTDNGPENYDHLRNWVIEVSNDKEKWDVIDKHDDDTSLRGANIIHTFSVQKAEGFHRYIRIRQTGHSWNGSYYLRFYFIEFYGMLKESKELCK
ncbi:hypothetical protein M9Y10_016893 [Tritrichomonas musculus]|uniref:BACK domain-containing protein n=1 Tax=Tritrichomonas musculus TaxID=1915356 RepID=A0ABR2HY67_9EUKA